ncbi:MAG: hypothetical protein GXY86_08820 [Firmicutes bacterium]|nr:hypothetical protein [Bacillota bacterium]
MIPKPKKAKTCLDMSELPFGKTNQKQRENKKIRKVIDRCKCRIPGCNKEAQKAFHHIIQKSDILIDHPLNFIRLCDIHHPEADEFKISQVDLFELVAHDNKITVEELLRTLEDFAGASIYIEGESIKVAKPIYQRRTG